MFSENVSVLVSPFWESVDQQWIGGMLVVLSLMMLCSQGLTIARVKSWRMYLASVTFLMLAGLMTASFADSRSPRELQHWIMASSTLTTLAVLQILWVAMTVFFSVKEEIAERKRGLVYWLKQSVIRLVSVLPSPVLLLFLVWMEQNLLMSSTDVRPQVIGLQTAGVLCGILTAFSVLPFLFLKSHQKIGLHLLLGCFLMLITVLVPCLTTKLYWDSPAALPDSGNVVPLVIVAVLLVLVGIFWPKQFFHKLLQRMQRES